MFNKADLPFITLPLHLKQPLILASPANRAAFIPNIRVIARE
jgi:hypothetical protein